MERTRNRPQISKKAIKEARDEIYQKTLSAFQQKGWGSLASIHELSGVLKEEYDEVSDEIHASNYPMLIEELKDLAVACLFGIACIKSKTMDW